MEEKRASALRMYTLIVEIGISRVIKYICEYLLIMVSFMKVRLLVL